MNLRKSFAIVFLVLCFFITRDANAITTSLFGNIAIEINPTYPKPGQRALVSVNTNSLDLDRTEITWLVNGSVVKQGMGEKSIGLNIGKAGTPTKIEVRVNSQTLGKLTDSVTITPGEVDILWESNTYTPNLYKGKPLHSSESQITVLAIPNISLSGNKIPSNDLIYNWKIDENPMIDKSGFGKNSFSYVGPKIFGSDTIEVVVSTKDNSVYASNRITVTTVDPEIIFYEENDLFGTNYAKVIPYNFYMQGTEFKIRTEPFYFTKSNLDPKYTNYDWSMDGRKINTPSSPTILTLRHSAGRGSSNIILDMKNTKKSLQEASGSLNVYFGNNL